MRLSKYHSIKRIVRWCSFHRGKSFHYHDVGVHSSTLGSLCNTKFRGKIWIVKKGKAVTKDGNNGLAMYGLSSWVDVDNFH